jgi:RNA methyltransferase, TrmH family
MMQLIESRQNPHIKQIRRILAGREREYFLIEGQKLLDEAMKSGVKLVHIFVRADYRRRERGLLEQSGAEVHTLADSLLKYVSDVETPQGIVAIARRPELASVRVPKDYAGLLYSIRDPGNLGTIFRAAEAAGCEFLAMTKDCAEPYQPKVVRAAMGSLFRVPIIELEDTESYLQKCKREGVSLYGLFPKGGKSLFKIEPKYPAILLIGSESHGLPEHLSLDYRLSIPMKGRVESINVAMAATIGFYFFVGKQS